MDGWFRWVCSGFWICLDDFLRWVFQPFMDSRGKTHNYAQRVTLPAHGKNERLKWKFFKMIRCTKYPWTDPLGRICIFTYGYVTEKIHKMHANAVYRMPSIFYRNLTTEIHLHKASFLDFSLRSSRVYKDINNMLWIGSFVTSDLSQNLKSIFWSKSRWLLQNQWDSFWESWCITTGQKGNPKTLPTRASQSADLPFPLSYLYGLCFADKQQWWVHWRQGCVWNLRKNGERNDEASPRWLPCSKLTQP